MLICYHVRRESYYYTYVRLLKSGQNLTGYISLVLSDLITLYCTLDAIPTIESDLLLFNVIKNFFDVLAKIMFH